MSSFTESTNYYKILKIAKIAIEFKQQDLIYVLGLHGKVLAEHLRKLLNAQYLKIDRISGRMKFYSITDLGNAYVEVYEKVISHLKDIDRYISITKTKYGDLSDTHDLQNITYIIKRDYKEIKNKK